MDFNGNDTTSIAYYFLSMIFFLFLNKKAFVVVLRRLSTRIDRKERVIFGVIYFWQVNSEKMFRVSGFVFLIFLTLTVAFFIEITSSEL